MATMVVSNEQDDSGLWVCPFCARRLRGGRKTKTGETILPRHHIRRGVIADKEYNVGWCDGETTLCENLECSNPALGYVEDVEDDNGEGYDVGECEECCNDGMFEETDCVNTDNGCPDAGN